MFSCLLRQLFVFRLFSPFMHFPAFFASYSLSCLRRQLFVFPPFSPVTRFSAFLARYSLPTISGVFDRLLVHQSPSVLHFPALLTSDSFLTADPFPALFANDLFSLVSFLHCRMFTHAESHLFCHSVQRLH